MEVLAHVVFGLRTANEHWQLVNILDSESRLGLCLLVDRRLTGFRQLVCVALLDCSASHRAWSPVLEPFPFSDLVIGGITVVDAHDEVGVFLGRLRRLVNRCGGYGLQLLQWLHVLARSVLYLRLI